LTAKAAERQFAIKEAAAPGFRVTTLRLCKRGIAWPAWLSSSIHPALLSLRFTSPCCFILQDNGI
jgi:hypothetical protein